MRKFHCNETVRFQQTFHASNEVVEIGHMSEDIVAEQQVRLSVLRRDLLRSVAAEELHFCPHTLLDCNLGDVCGGFDTEHGNVGTNEVL